MERTARALSPLGRTCLLLALMALMLESCYGQGPQGLIVARRTELRFMNLSTSELTLIPAKNITNIIAVDYDPTVGMIYWSDVNMGTINRIKLDGSSQEILFATNVTTVDGLEVDATNRLLYWTDATFNRIERASLDGQNRQVILDSDLDEPRAIQLDIANSTLYWTDWGANPKIERAKTDGSLRQVLVDTGLAWPNGLTLDISNNLMYWVDAGTDQIERTNLDGNNRTLLASGTSHPFSCVLYNGYLYWTDWGRADVERFNVVAGSDHSVVMSYMPNHMGLKVTRLANGQNVAFVCGRNEIRTYNLSVPRDLGSVIPLANNNTDTVALDYNPVNDRIYWTDVGNKLIRSSKRDGSDQLTLASTDVDTPDGIAVSVSSAYVFWTDAGRDVIERSAYDGSGRSVIVNTDLDQPRAIAVDDINSMIYWTDWGDTAKVERATFSGGSRQLLISTDLLWPNGLALDPSNNMMYWVDGALNRIEGSALDGSNRRQIIGNSMVIQQGFDLSFHENNLYWTDWKTKLIVRLNTENTSDISIITDGNSFFTGLALVDAPTTDYCHSSPSCLNGATCVNGNSGYNCHCPSGFLGHRCQQVNHCLSSPCANHGSCANEESGFQCHCAPGFMGTTCEQAIVNHCLPSPCANHGSCLNEESGFQCHCATGFTGTRCEQESKGYCQSSPCMNGGTCTNLDSGFSCSCSDRFVGTRCEQAVTPRLDSAEPLFGPIAGGTRVTITGDNFFLPLGFVTFHTGRELTVVNSSKTTIVVATPEVDASDIIEDLTIVVKFADWPEVETPFVFSYLANPTVHTVEPLTTIPKGGVTLTVNGTNFKSVAHPEMNMTAVFMQGADDERTDSYQTPCEVVDSFQLECITPEIELYSAKEGRSSEPDSPCKQTDGKCPEVTFQDVTLYIGIILDGVPDYRNLSDNTQLKDFGIVAVTSDPTFNHTQEFVYDGEPILVKGANMKSCCRQSEFRVFIGNSTCGDLKVLDDSISCVPQDHKTMSQSYYSKTGEKEGYPVWVHVGAAIKVDVGVIKYQRVLPVWAGVLIAIGGTAMLAGIAALVVCLWKRRRRVYSMQKTTSQGAFSGDQLDDGANFVSFPEIEASNLEDFDVSVARADSVDSGTSSVDVSGFSNPAYQP